VLRVQRRSVGLKERLGVGWILGRAPDIRRTGGAVWVSVGLFRGRTDGFVVSAEECLARTGAEGMRSAFCRTDEISEAAYTDYIGEWEATGETIVPMSSDRAYETGFVPNTVFFLVQRPGRILGSLSFRHHLRDRLEFQGVWTRRYWIPRTAGPSR